MFAKFYRLFTLPGFEIRAGPSWLAIAALLVWSLATGYFPAAAEGAAELTYLALGAAAAAGLFASLVLHEAGHALMARRTGMRVTRTTLFLFGGVAELDKDPKSPAAEIQFALAGPAMSLALAALFWLAAAAARSLGAAAPVPALLAWLALVNALLAAFNLLPGFPLDGGRIWRAVLWDRDGDLAAATRRAGELGTALAWALIAIGVWAVFAAGKGSGLWLLVTGVLLLTSARAACGQVIMKAALAGKPVAEMMSASPVTVSPGHSLSELAEQIMLRHSLTFVPVVEEGHLLGYIDSGVLRRIDRDNWTNTTVDDVFVGLRPEDCVSPSASADEVMDQLLASSRRKLMVVQGFRLVGIISLSDLAGYLSVIKSLSGGAVPADHDGIWPRNA